MNPPTKFALMRANRPKLVLARRVADQIEAQRAAGMDGVEVTVLLSAHGALAGPIPRPWWRAKEERPTQTVAAEARNP